MEEEIMDILTALPKLKVFFFLVISFFGFFGLN